MRVVVRGWRAIAKCLQLGRSWVEKGLSVAAMPASSGSFDSVPHDETVRGSAQDDRGACVLVLILGFARFSEGVAGG